jgi:predicted nucleic acid-binding protein
MSPSNDVEALAEYSHPYLDSSVYIAVIQGEDGRVEDTRQILRNAERNELRIVATTLVLAEVHKAGTADWTTDKIDRYFHRPHFLWVEVDYPVGVRARTLAREHRLRGADAIHLAGALRAGADVFFTYDKRILATSDVGIHVAEPFFRGQLSLSDEPEQEPQHEPE